jgi:hypothetical protein
MMDEQTALRWEIMRTILETRGIPPDFAIKEAERVLEWVRKGPEVDMAKFFDDYHRKPASP